MSIKSHIKYINIKKMMQKSKFTLKKATSAYFPQTLFFHWEERKEEEKRERERRRWAERERFFFVRKGCVLYYISTPIYPKSSH